MIENLWQTILYNLVMGVMFLMPLVFCRFADITFGAIDAYKSSTLTFDWKKIGKSVVSTLLLLVGMASLICGVVTLPEIMKYYNIEIVDTDLLEQMITIVMIVMVLIGTAITYAKDAFIKLKKLLSGNYTEIEAENSTQAHIDIMEYADAE